MEEQGVGERRRAEAALEPAEARGQRLLRQRRRWSPRRCEAAEALEAEQEEGGGGAEGWWRRREDGGEGARRRRCEAVEEGGWKVKSAEAVEQEERGGMIERERERERKRQREI
ncbi:uncharacterized protein LOC130993872 [Salvia miltiorrhiza]|uniref:uncharacterized protein LOC130993872 n=1 Tax=Salvia miltiorrhiza TaxID=226208 RepID=UPI0025AC8D7E|nr:uncharacterized protein LOC130993872 [Salvia miltiorrhiza]